MESYNLAAEQQLRKLIAGRPVIYLTTKNLDYIRCSQEIRMLKRISSSVTVIGSNAKGYGTRLGAVYAALLRWGNTSRKVALRVDVIPKEKQVIDNKGQVESDDLRDSDYVVYVGFAPQLVLPFFWKRFRGHLVIQDFFISFYDTLVNDRKKVKVGSAPAKFLHCLDSTTLQKSGYVVADTNADVDYFSKEFGREQEKFITLYLEADPAIYHESDPANAEDKTSCTDTNGNLNCSRGNSRFNVLYFGSVLPLQGVDVVLDAMGQLRDDQRFSFTMIGPVDPDKKILSDNIQYYDWLPQDELAAKIAEADLCLAGHFSGTIDKARRTIAGKTFIYRAMGKPVILGDCPANRELFQKEKKQVYFTEMGNADSLKNTIVTAWNDLKNNVA